MRARRVSPFLITSGIVVLIVVAAAIRAPGLGRWCYAVDEFYFSQSVSFIVERGVPEYSTGGYYTRGLIVQYLAALPALALGQSGATDRVVPLIFGVASIAMFWVLCRRYLREPFAFAAAAALVVSSWHIEFSRFARFYSAILFMFLLFLYALYRGYWRHERRWAVLAWIVAALSVFVHEASIFFPFFAVLVMLRSDALLTKRNLRLTACAAPVLLLGYLVHTAGTRHWGVRDPLPVGMPGSGRLSTMTAPILDLASAAVSDRLSLAGLAALAVVGVVVAVRNRDRCDNRWRRLLSLAILVLPLFHQYGGLVLLSALYALTRPSRRDGLGSLLRVWAPYLILTVAFWIAVAVFSGDAWLPDERFVVRIYRLVLSMFSHFSIHASVALPFLRQVPLWSAALLSALAISLVRNLTSRRADLSRLPLAAVVLLALLLPILDFPFHSTRYSFFFYPLVLSLLFTESFALSRWVSRRLPGRPRGLVRAGVALPLVLLACSEDFFVRHVLDVSAAELNFRTGRFERLQHHWYGRFDYESPADFVNDRYRPGDVVVTDAIVSSHYLEPEFTNYVSKEHGRFRGMSRERGTTEGWTGSRLAYDPEGLAALVPQRGAGRLWLIAAAGWHTAGSFRTADDVEAFAARHGLDASLEFTASDGRLGVWSVQRGLEETG